MKKIIDVMRKTIISVWWICESGNWEWI